MKRSKRITADNSNVKGLLNAFPEVMTSSHKIYEKFVDFDQKYPKKLKFKPL
jgi:hypothetical protein